VGGGSDVARSGHGDLTRGVPLQIVAKSCWSANGLSLLGVISVCLVRWRTGGYGGFTDEKSRQTCDLGISATKTRSAEAPALNDDVDSRIH